MPRSAHVRRRAPAAHPNEAFTSSGTNRLVLLAAVRHLVTKARSARAACHGDTLEREFYLGVAAAGDELLYPRISRGRRANWLDRETPAFRKGYLRTRASLGQALSATEPQGPLRLPALVEVGE